MIVRSSMAAARFTASTLDLEALATQAEVDVVLTGTLLGVAGRLRVNAQLVSVPDGTILWSDRMDVPIDDLIRDTGRAERADRRFAGRTPLAARTGNPQA